MRLFNTLLCLMVMLPEIALGETVMAARTIPSHTILTAADVIMKGVEVPGALREIPGLVGLEARVVLYEGRPIMAHDIGPAAIIERNQIVTLIFSKGPLLISTEARSLGRAGSGDLLRVMNVSSRTTVTGIVQSNGTVLVGTNNN